MMANDFFELYKHPLWQKKRLEIMERDKFQCQNCYSADKTLNVHHTAYEKGRKPWEYADGFLVTLCEDCHQKHEALRRGILRAAGRLNYDGQSVIYGFASALDMRQNGTASGVNGWEEFCRGFAIGLGVNYDAFAHRFLNSKAITAGEARDFCQSQIRLASDIQRAIDDVNAEDRDRILGYIQAVRMHRPENSHYYSIEFKNDQHARGIADAVGLSVSELQNLSAGPDELIWEEAIKRPGNTH